MYCSKIYIINTWQHSGGNNNQETRFAINATQKFLMAKEVYGMIKNGYLYSDRLYCEKCMNKTINDPTLLKNLQDYPDFMGEGLIQKVISIFTAVFFVIVLQVPVAFSKDATELNATNFETKLAETGLPSVVFFTSKGYPQCIVLLEKMEGFEKNFCWTCLCSYESNKTIGFIHSISNFNCVFLKIKFHVNFYKFAKFRIIVHFSFNC